MTKPPIPPSCGTCQHWKPVTDGYNIGYSPTYIEGESWEAESARQVAVERLYGTCQGISEIPEREDFEPPNEPPIAFTMDGSHYRASLHTRAEFGCVLHSVASLSDDPAPSQASE